MQRTEIKEITIILFVLSIIGACSGMAGGMIRVAAVGSIIPAFLGLLGGFISFTLGAQYRNISDDHRNIREKCAKAYTDQKLLDNPTAFLKFRERMGALCDASMSWEIAE